MRRWSALIARVAATARTSEKTALIAGHLAGLDAAELPVAAVLLTGRPFPEADPRTLGIGWAAIAAAVARLAGTAEGELAAAYDRHSDAARAVEEVLAAAGWRPAEGGEPTLPEVADAFAAIAGAATAGEKGELLEGFLARCSPATAGAVVRVVAGDLRIGLRAGLLETAIAAAFGRERAAVGGAVMLTGDVGRVAVLARDDRLGSATLTLFHPVRPMLASPAGDAAEIVRRLGPVVWVEDKYDGIRVQLHRGGGEVRLWSRDLREVTAQFPEIVEAARDLPWSGVLDGELLAWRDGTVLPFLRLQARLGRRRPGPALLAEVPVVVVAWDAVALDTDGDGTVIALLDEPLAERRRRLEALELPRTEAGGRFALSARTEARTVDELEAAFAAARARRNEGLLVKDPRSAYTPGRRGLGWLKLKRALATLDCVVTGVEGGHGRRHGILSDQTFAVRDEASGALVTIGKAYSGLTDAELAELTRHFEATTISVHGRFLRVEPTVVVEVAFDAITRSPRHRSGFALRFPRIVRVRTDRSAADVDTLATVARRFEELQADPGELVAGGRRGSGTS